MLEDRLGSPAPPLAASTYAGRRDRLIARLGEGVAVLASAAEQYRSGDTEIRYRPDSDLHYLTGFDEPQCVVVLTPHDPAHRFTIFLRERDPDREVWSGGRVGVEGAQERLGADDAYPIAELDQRLPELFRPASAVHYRFDQAAVGELVLRTLPRARQGRARSGEGPTALLDLGITLGEMRLIKDAEEIERLRVAAEIAVRGHRAAMAAAHPGVGEWELEAELEGSFRRSGAGGPAFPSIVGAGANATVLHYVANRDRAAAGDLVLMDAGAEWGLYCSDVTRTFPVSGRFSPPQRALYEVVLAAQRAAISAARPGAPVSDLHDAALRVMVPGMIRLGLLEGDDPESLIEQGAYRRFYMHQTSHWLGLDVHDVGLYRRDGVPVPLEPGMVLTVEPGIYVPPGATDVPEPYRGLGIRIEDDVLITAGGAEVLTGSLPTDAEEVEALVGSVEGELNGVHRSGRG